MSDLDGFARILCVELAWVIEYKVLTLQRYHDKVEGLRKFKSPIILAACRVSVIPRLQAWQLGARLTIAWRRRGFGSTCATMYQKTNDLTRLNLWD